MATTVSKDILSTVNQLVLAQWANLSQGQTGDPATYVGGFPDRSFQVAGTFGGATVTLEGSNDGIEWETLTEARTGDPISFTAKGIKQVYEATYLVRAKVTGGDGTTAIRASLFGTRPA